MNFYTPIVWFYWVSELALGYNLYLVVFRQDLFTFCQISTIQNMPNKPLAIPFCKAIMDVASTTTGLLW